MTLSTLTNRITYPSNGSIGPFVYSFRIFEDSDLLVSKVNDTDGVETTLVLSTDYTVSGAGSGSGGNVTLVSALAAGYTIVIVRNIPATQETAYVENDPFPSTAHEAALDKLTMLVQQLLDTQERTLYANTAESAEADLELPLLVPSCLIGTDGSGAALRLIAFGTEGLTSLPTVYSVASQVAQLALTAQRGDVAVRSDNGRSYTRNSGAVGDMTDWTIHPLPVDTDGTLAANSDSWIATQKATKTYTDTTISALLLHGQCRLTKSSTNLLLAPYNGNKIIINGIVRSIPSSGVTLAPTALTPNTTYLIYAYWTGSALALEASATAHATDTTTGVEVKSGDATRTLVGIARIITGPAWVDTVAQRFVLSWFNRREIESIGIMTTSRSTSSTSWVDLVASSERAEFLTWCDARVLTIANTLSDTLHQNILTGIGIDGVLAYGSSFTDMSAPEPISAFAAIAFHQTSVLSEGYHYASLFGTVYGGGSALWKATSFMRATIFG